MTTTAGPKNRRALVILVVLAVLGALIAVGGATAMIWLRTAAPNASFESVVSPAIPLVAGDSVTFREGNRSCDGVPVLGTLSDGRVTIMACQGVSRPIPVSRSLLRLYRFPDRGSVLDPEVGDIVLVEESGRYVRAEIVAPEPMQRLRIRPLRVAPDALDTDVTERIVPRAAALLVQRPSRAQRTFVSIDEVPLRAGDRLTERDTNGTMLYDVIVSSPSPRGDVLVQRMVGLTPDGAPRTVTRARLSALVLHPFDAIEAGAIVLDPSTRDHARVVVVSGAEAPELCVRDEDADPTTPCRLLPKSGVVVVRSGS